MTDNVPYIPNYSITQFREAFFEHNNHEHYPNIVEIPDKYKRSSEFDIFSNKVLKKHVSPNRTNYYIISISLNGRGKKGIGLHDFNLEPNTLSIVLPAQFFMMSIMKA